jgi:recombination protein RecT
MPNRESQMANKPPPPPSSAVVVIDRKESYAKIQTAITEQEARILAALSPTISSRSFMTAALQAVARSPGLLECTPASFVLALMDAAELGLVPSGLLGSAYLVPYKNSKSGRMEAKLIPGYRGLIDLARRSGEVSTVEGRVVRQRDAFEFEYGTRQYLRHVPYLNLNAERGDPFLDDRGEERQGLILDGGPYVAAYARAVLSSGEEQFIVQPIAWVNGIRARSKAKDSGPWVSDYEPMAAKTMIRSLMKYLPVAVDRLTRALELEDLAEGEAATPTVAESPARRALQAALGVAPAEEASTDDSEAQEGSDQAVDAPEGTDGTVKAEAFDDLDF